MATRELYDLQPMRPDRAVFAIFLRQGGLHGRNVPAVFVILLRPDGLHVRNVTAVLAILLRPDGLHVRNNEAVFVNLPYWLTSISPPYLVTESNLVTRPARPAGNGTGSVDAGLTENRLDAEVVGCCFTAGTNGDNNSKMAEIAVLNYHQIRNRIWVASER